MPVFYHLDRTNSLKKGDIINLHKVNNISCDEYKITPMLQEHLEELFPYGLSHHGDNYFASSNCIPYLHPVLELLMEYIRRCSYSYMPSRGESFFAVETVNDAVRLCNVLKENPNNASIWEVECDIAFKFDMFLLDIAQSFIGLKNSSNLFTSLLINMYWEGRSIKEILPDDNPFWEYLLLPPVKIIKKVNI